MAEWRTQQQIDADEALHAAIVGVLSAYADPPGCNDPYMLAEYLVITAQVGMSDDKADHTKYDYMLSNGSLPWHKMMGLMSWGKLTMEADMKGAEDS